MCMCALHVFIKCMSIYVLRVYQSMCVRGDFCFSLAFVVPNGKLGVVCCVCCIEP